MATKMRSDLTHLKAAEEKVAQEFGFTPRETSQLVATVINIAEKGVKIKIPAQNKCHYSVSYATELTY